jgi:hypothetical protein
MQRIIPSTVAKKQRKAGHIGFRENAKKPGAKAGFSLSRGRKAGAEKG